MTSSELDHGDEWQNNLDRWREKRRQQISQKTQLVETSRKDEEEDYKKKIDDIRHNIKRIQMQRVSLTGISTEDYSDNDDTIKYSKNDRNNFAIISNDKENLSTENSLLDSKFSPDRPIFVRKEGHALKIGDSNFSVDIKDAEGKIHEPDAIEIENDKIINDLKKHLNSSRYFNDDLSSSQASDEDCGLTNETKEKMRFLNFKLIAKPGMKKDVNWGISLKSDCDDPSRRGSLIRISGIKMGSSADLCELKKGDILISINNKRLLDSSNSFLSQIEVEELLKSVVSDSLLLTIRRSEDSSEVDESDIDDDDNTEVPKVLEESISEKTISHTQDDNQTTQILKDELKDSKPDLFNEKEKVIIHQNTSVKNQIDQSVSLHNQTTNNSLDSIKSEFKSEAKVKEDVLTSQGDSVASKTKEIKLKEFNYGPNDISYNTKSKTKFNDVITKNLCTITNQTPTLSYDVLLPPEIYASDEPVDAISGLKISNYNSEVVNIDCVNNRKILTKVQKIKEQFHPEEKSPSKTKENNEDRCQSEFSPTPEKRGIRPVKEPESSINSQIDSPPLPPRSMPRNFEFFDGIRPYKKPFKPSSQTKQKDTNFPPRPKRNSRRDNHIKLCNVCENELGTGALMIIQSLELYYHLDCFRCCSCRLILCDGNSDCEVRIKRGNLYCNKCYGYLTEETKFSPHNTDFSYTNHCKSESLRKQFNQSQRDVRYIQKLTTNTENSLHPTSISNNYARNDKNLFQDHLLQPYRRLSLECLDSPSSPHQMQSLTNDRKDSSKSRVQIHSRSFVGYF